MKKLKIFLIGNKGYATMILKSLLKNHENVVGLCCKDDYLPLRKSVKQYIASKLKTLAFCHNDHFYHKDPFEAFESLKKIALKNRIPVLYSDKLRNPEFETTLKNLAPDLILVTGFHRLIPLNIIKLPNKAIINLHPSLLPRHRGGTPCRWVIRYGEKETGVTAHFVNEKFDCGDIILQKRLKINPNETYGGLKLRTSDLMVKMVHRVIQMVRNGSIKGIPQDNNHATYEPAFRGNYQIVDWSLPVLEIKQICYAIRPKSGGITNLRNRKTCVWDLEVLDNTTSEQLPGTIVEIDHNGYPIVSCGEGRAKILSFLHSGKIVRADKIIKKLGIQKWERLGVI